MIFNRQIFPMLKIDKISIFKNNKYSFGIEYSINQLSSRSESKVREMLEFLENKIQIVFVVLHTETENYLSQFENNNIRHKTLQEFKIKNKHFVKEVSLGDFIRKSELKKLKSKGNSVERLMTFSGLEIIELPPLTEQQEKITKKMHLLGFLTYCNPEFAVVKYLHTKNSTLEYEPLLVSDSTGLVPATEKQSFYTRSIQNTNRLLPYVGPAHYHGPSNPAPNGYIGWMSGHKKGKMGPPLIVKTVRNYKLIVEDDIFEFKDRVNDFEVPKTYSNDSTGTGLVQKTKSLTNFSKLIPKLEVQKKKANISIETIEKDQKSFFHGYGNETFHISTSQERTSKQEKYHEKKYNNYYGSIFGIDILSLIKYKSEYGALLSYHYKNSNIGIVTEALKSSSIEKIQITRRRLSNKPNFKNQNGTKDYSKFNQDNKKIVFSSDKKTSSAYKNLLIRYRTLDGEIQEVNLAAMNNAGRIFDHPDCKYVRQFLFKDFDIFHNIDNGVYTYDVELEISDGMKMMLEKKYQQFKQMVLSFERYSEKANILFLASQKSSKGKNQYNDFLKNRSKSLKLDRIVFEYFETLRLIEGIDPSKNRRKSLQNSISPKNVDINSINKFYDSLKKAQLLFERLLNKKLNQSIKKKSSTNLTGIVPGNIIANFKTGIRAEAFSSSKLIADYSLNNTSQSTMDLDSLKEISLLRSQPINSSRAPNMGMTPRNLVTITGQKYEVKDKFTARPGNEKKKTDLHFNVIAGYQDLESTQTNSTANLKFKIAVLEQEESEKKSLLNKGDIYYSNAVQQLGKGAKIKINGKDLGPSKSEDGSLKEDQASPVLSSKVQESIFNASKKAENKEASLKLIQEEYKNIFNIRDKLGTIYDSMVTGFKAGEKIVSSINKDKIYESKYKGRNFNIRTSQSQTSLANEYIADLYVCLPGIYKQKINLNNIVYDKIPRRQNMVKKYILIKLEQTYSKNVLLSNNLVLVEV